MPPDAQIPKFDTLDALAEAMPPGLIRYRAGDREPLGRIAGYVWGLPRRPGEPKVASLVIATERGTIGTVYPDEVTVHAGLPAFSTKDQPEEADRG